MKKNIKEAKALVEAYKNILAGSAALMNARNSMSNVSSEFANEKSVHTDILEITTGFGSTSTCTLCKPISRLIVGNKTYLACNECVWGYEGYEKDNVTPCINKNFERLREKVTEQEFLDLLKERIDLLEKRIKEAEEIELPEDIDSLELADFIEKLKKSRKKHGSEHFHSIHEALGVCHEELYEATVEIHANKIEEAADELLDLAVAAFWGHKSFKKKKVKE